MQIKDMAFGTFFPLKDVRAFSSPCRKEVFQAIYAMSEDEVTYQNLMLDKVLDTVCNYMLPALVPAADLPSISFTHSADVDRKCLKGAAKMSRMLKAAIHFHAAPADSAYGHDDIFYVKVIADSQFSDTQRNLLAVKYALLCDIFQPHYSSFNLFSNGCLDFPTWATIKRTHMGKAAINCLAIYVNRQDTIEDIIASFFIDGIPFDGFSEEA